jgi:hypothetical protein
LTRKLAKLQPIAWSALTVGTKTGTWQVDSTNLSGATLPAKTQGTQHYSRFVFVPALGCLAWIAHATDSVIIMRPER